MMKFRNPTESTLNLEPLGLGRVPPGGEVWVEEGLYRPARKANGSRGPSSIEEIAHQMQPVASGEWVAEWRKAPTPPAPVSRMVTVDTLHAQLPPAIVEARKAFEAAAIAPSAPPEAPADPVAAPEVLPAAETAPPAKRAPGRPPKRRLDPDVAASNPGVTSGILDTED